MGKRRFAAGTAAFLGMLVLILDGKTAVQGASDGITICLRTVIPSLFPFFFLSNMLTGVLIGYEIKMLRPLGKLLAIPAGMESLLIPAFLGGYPVGTQAVAKAWRQGHIPREEAQRLLAFCNNAGPAFLFGMVGPMFPNWYTPWLLWGIQILSAMMVAIIFPGTGKYTGTISHQNQSLTASLRASLTAMASVCGWIVIFRVVISFLQRWILWIVPKSFLPLIMGMLELSNGCMALLDVENLKLRFVICSGMLAFGGLCIMMQVSSAAEGLNVRRFYQGKCAQTLIAVFLAMGIVWTKATFWILPLLLVSLFVGNRRKSGSIPAKAGV